jgi:hypothetical protein
MIVEPARYVGQPSLRVDVVELGGLDQLAWQQSMPPCRRGHLSRTAFALGHDPQLLFEAPPTSGPGPIRHPVDIGVKNPPTTVKTDGGMNQSGGHRR